MPGRLFPSKAEVREIRPSTRRTIEVLMAICLIFGGWVVVDGLRNFNWESNASTPHQTRNKPIAATDSLGWLHGGTNKYFVALCAKTMKVAQAYPAHSGRIDSANFYCGRAAARLMSGDEPGCSELLRRLPDAIGDQTMNVITTGGNIALACEDTEWLKPMIEDGTADNPIYPHFNPGYRGTLL